MFQAKLKNTYKVFAMVLALVAHSTSLPSQARIRRSQQSTDQPQPSDQLPVQAYSDFIRDIYGKASDIQSETADAIESPLTALRSHITLISDMYFHIRKCHSIGQIGQQSLRNAETERYHLEQVSRLLQNMNVSLNNCLQQEIQNEPVDMVFYSSFFLRIPEIYRAYIILNDNLDLMAYLKEIHEIVFPALKRL